MRYAIFSDIHGNWQAWNAVLADMYDSNVDVPVCLGDIVGYGPCPQKVLEGIREVTINFVMGNHDAAATGVLDPHMFNDKARSVIEWTREQLDEQSMEFLRDMPMVIEDGDLMFVHAEIEEPGRFLYIDSEEEAQDNLQYNTQRITFVGHTHDPAVFAQGDDGTVSRHEDTDCVLSTDQRYIVNVGSVGEPRNPEDIRARYVIFDSDTNELTFRRIEFDVEAYRSDLAASGLTITPYFLTVVDSYREAVAMSQQAQLMRDMRTPVHAPTLLQRRAGTIQTTLTGRPPLRRDTPLIEPSKSNAPKVVFFFTLTLFLITLSIFGIIFFGGESRPEWAKNAAASFGRNVEKKPDVDPLASGETATVMPDEPEISMDPTPLAQLAYWRIDNGNTALQNPSMANSVIGKQAPPLLKKVPRSGKGNLGAASGAAWKETEASGLYSIERDKSFTLELFFALKSPDRINFIAGDRTDDSKDNIGWQIHAESGDRMTFVYDSGTEPELTASFFLPDLYNGRPHHLAVVWDHADHVESGKITVYLDGEAEAEVAIPRSRIPLNPTGKKFAIGGRIASPKDFIFTGTLDEVRMNAGVLPTSHFLMADPNGKLITLNPGATKLKDVVTDKPGRTIRIALPGFNVLSLAEVEVIVGGKNVAPEGSATQSSKYGDGLAERAIDGNKSDIFTDGGITHTKDAENQWWEIDLGSDYPIDKIQIWNRGEEFSHRLDNFNISIWNEAKELVFQKGGNKAPEGSIVFDLKQKGEVTYFATGEEPGAPKIELVEQQPQMVTPPPTPNASAEVNMWEFKSGLLFYTPFDEPTGEKVLLDLSGNGRNLDVGKTKIAQPGQVGNAVQFQKNGFTSLARPFGKTEHVTFSFWINPDAEQIQAESPAIVVTIDGFAKVTYDDSRIGVNLSGASLTTVVDFIPDGNWHHFVAENDGTSTKLFKDGRQLFTVPRPTTARSTPANASVKIGAGDSRFQLDEVAIWRRLLTADEKLVLFKTGQNGKPLIKTPEVVAYWKFDEKEGQIFNDIGGKFPLGSLTKPVPKDPIAPNPIPLTQKKNEGAVEVQTLIQPPESDATTFEMTAKKNFTYEGWFTPTIQKMATIGRTNAKNDDAIGWRFAVAPEKSGRKGSVIFRYELGDNPPKALATEQDVYDGNPHHFAAVWDAVTGEGVGKMLIFVDGKRVADQEVPHSVLVNGKSDPLQIGGPGNEFVIDELRFTREALSNRLFLRYGAAPKAAAPAAPKK